MMPLRATDMSAENGGSFSYERIMPYSEGNNHEIGAAISGIIPNMPLISIRGAVTEVASGRSPGSAIHFLNPEP